MKKKKARGFLVGASKRTPRKPVPYEMVLKLIHENLKEAEAWAGEGIAAVIALHEGSLSVIQTLETALGHLHYAECLLALLEVHNCGQVGGYDTHRGLSQDTLTPFMASLKDRLWWLEEVR